MMVPAPAVPVRIRTQTAASHGLPGVPAATRTPGPGGDTQQRRAQQQRAQQHAQPLHHKRSVHQPVQRRTDVPAVKNPAVDRAEVADEAGPPVVGFGPAQAPITAASATKYWTTLSTAQAPMYCRVEAVSGRKVPRRGRTSAADSCQERSTRLPPCMLVSVSGRAGPAGTTDTRPRSSVDRARLS